MTNVLIHKIDYENQGRDIIDEAIAIIAEFIGTDLTGCNVVLYDGASNEGKVYPTLVLGKVTLCDRENGLGTVRNDFKGTAIPAFSETPDGTENPISEFQRVAHTSPSEVQSLGIITALDSKGFYLQIEDEHFARFDPVQDGIDFHENLEGMRVSGAIAVSASDRFENLFTLPDKGANDTRVFYYKDFSLERIQIQRDRHRIALQEIQDHDRSENSDREPILSHLTLPALFNEIKSDAKGSEKEDAIISMQGRDLLSGGGGNNRFVSTSFRDARDRIAHVKSDRRFLTKLLQGLRDRRADLSARSFAF